MLAVAALKLNVGLRELYLSDNDLGVVDAIQLGGLLRSNFTLQLLDIR
jgi:protein phosphatase 1 regulatory subunit 37